MFVKRVLGILDANMDPDDFSISSTLHALGRCVREAGRWGEAEV